MLKIKDLDELPQDRDGLISKWNNVRSRVLLINGFPGFRTNFDLAQHLRRGGLDVSRFAYPRQDGEPLDRPFASLVEAALARLTAFYAEPGAAAVVAYCFGGWLIARHLAQVAPPASVRIVLMAPLLDLSAFRAHYEGSDNDLREMLFRPAARLLGGAHECWAADWRRIEAEPHAADFPATTAVVAAARDTLLDPANIELGRTIGRARLLHTLDTRHHYFNDQRPALCATVQSLLESHIYSPSDLRGTPGLTMEAL